MGLRIVLFGAPGAGKGTQAAETAKKYNIVHISTGEIFRKNLREGTELGLEARKYMDSGRLVPDDVTVRMVEQRLREPDCTNGFVLDGFPRTEAQAEALTEFLGEAGLALNAVINIEVDDELVVQRLSSRRQCPDCGAVFNVLTLRPRLEGVCDRCGSKLVLRPDDSPDTIKNRLEVYRVESAPVLDYYRARSLVSNIDGTGSVGETDAEIDAVLASRGGVQHDAR